MLYKETISFKNKNTFISDNLVNRKTNSPVDYALSELQHPQTLGSPPPNGKQSPQLACVNKVVPWINFLSRCARKPAVLVLSQLGSFFLLYRSKAVESRYCQF